jgi:hypothetical protein
VVAGGPLLATWWEELAIAPFSVPEVSGGDSETFAFESEVELMLLRRLYVFLSAAHATISENIVTRIKYVYVKAEQRERILKSVEPRCKMIPPAEGSRFCYRIGIGDCDSGSAIKILTE